MKTEFFFTILDKVKIYTNVLIELKKWEKETDKATIKAEFPGTCGMLDYAAFSYFLTVYNWETFKSSYFAKNKVRLFPEFTKFYNKKFYPFWWPLTKEGIKERIEVIITIINNLYNEYYTS